MLFVQNINHPIKNKSSLHIHKHTTHLSPYKIKENKIKTALVAIQVSVIVKITQKSQCISSNSLSFKDQGCTGTSLHQYQFIQLVRDPPISLFKGSALHFYFCSFSSWDSAQDDPSMDLQVHEMSRCVGARISCICRT